LALVRLVSQGHPALARFGKRPPLARLPRTLQHDMRTYFGT